MTSKTVANSSSCPLCTDVGGVLVYQAQHFRVIQADEADFPAFYRVVWNRHIAEFSDLSPSDQAGCMRAVATVEQVLRQQLQPTKVNLAALGNAVPHLHWHVIARFDWDSHFPASVWAAPQRPVNREKLLAIGRRSAEMNRIMAVQLAIG